MALPSLARFIFLLYQPTATGTPKIWYVELEYFVKKI